MPNGCIFAAQSGVHNKNYEIVLAIDVISFMWNDLSNLFLLRLFKISKNWNKRMPFLSFQLDHNRSVIYAPHYYICEFSSMKLRIKKIWTIFVVGLVWFHLHQKQPWSKKAIYAPILCMPHELYSTFYNKLKFENEFSWTKRQLLNIQQLKCLLLFIEWYVQCNSRTIKRMPARGKKEREHNDYSISNR